MGKEKKDLQRDFRRKQFRYTQFWNMHYTERHSMGPERDFKTIIKARSYEQAKEILRLKSAEDDPNIKIKSIQGFMFHKSYSMLTPTKKKISFTDWKHIHEAAFPNENNVLFKIEVPRASWKTNRFNGSGKHNPRFVEHIKKVGFKKGKENWSYIHRKGKSLKPEDTTHLVYKGKWIPWDEKERNAIKKHLIQALKDNDNKRTAAAISLGLTHRNKIYNLMRKFPEIDWANDYPPPKRPGPPVFSTEQKSKWAKKAWKTLEKKGIPHFGGKSNSPEANAKRRETLRKLAAEKREEKYDLLEPQIRKALSANNHSRPKAAKALKMNNSTFNKYLHLLKKERGIDWHKEYPPRRQS